MAKRIYRKNKQSPADRAREKEAREKFQRKHLAEMIMTLKSMAWLIVLLFLVVGETLAGDAADEDAKPKVRAGDSIQTTIVGQLSTKWDARTLFYASVRAGGTEIELDPAGCSRITSELLDYINTQGGGVITDTEVEVNGFLVFEKRPKTITYRGISRDDANAVVPVLKVRWIKITTLPSGKDVGSIKRNRDRVDSTVVGKEK
jgi:hypothetical protein